MKENLNVFGDKLIVCSSDPVTGYTRTGYCEYLPGDRGLHIVCAQMTSEFLNYSKSMGNDLSTPRPEWGFPGLKEGDLWCLCATRWIEAYEANKAPKLKLNACPQELLNYIDIKVLQTFSI